MKNKTFTLSCDADSAQYLAEALSVYAHAAYPPGGSDCAQVSHQALLESAREILSNAANQGAELRRRQRTLMKAAVKWYFSEEGPGEASLAEPLVALFP